MSPSWGTVEGIELHLDQNVVYTDADIDEILAELNASSGGSVNTLEPASQSNRQIARLLAGSGLDSIRLACPTERGETVELMLVDGRWRRGADHG